MVSVTGCGQIFLSGSAMTIWFWGGTSLAGLLCASWCALYHRTGVMSTKFIYVKRVYERD